MVTEQHRSKPTYAIDQYSLSLMIYELLCGTCPFAGTYWELMHQHMDILPQALRQHRPELPPAIEQVVLKALAKDPQDRFATVLEFAQALKSASLNVSPPWDDDEFDWKKNSTVPMPAVSQAQINPPSPRQAIGQSHTARSTTQSAASRISAPAAPSVSPSPTAVYLSASLADSPIVTRLQAD